MTTLIADAMSTFFVEAVRLASSDILSRNEPKSSSARTTAPSKPRLSDDGNDRRMATTTARTRRPQSMAEKWAIVVSGKLLIKLRNWRTASRQDLTLAMGGGASVEECWSGWAWCGLGRSVRRTGPPERKSFVNSV